MTAHRDVRVVPQHTRRSSASTTGRVDPEQVLVAALGAIEAGSVAAVGDVFDLVGADAWRAALVVSGDTGVAHQAVVATFREVWQRPGDVPLTLGEARRWIVGVAARKGAEVAERGSSAAR